MKALTQKSLIAAVTVAAISGIAYAAPVGIVSDATSASGSTGVTVSATVAPILTFDVSTVALNLGALTSAGYSTGTLDIEVATNYINGATVTATSANGGLSGSGTSHLINNLDPVTLPNQSYQIGSVKNAASTDAMTGAVITDLAFSEINSAVAKEIYKVTKPERKTDGAADAVVSVRARSDDATPADAYEDVITLTVTSTF